MPIRTAAQIQSALDAKKPGTLGANRGKAEQADRAELAVVYRTQQRVHFSRQNPAFASVGEAVYYP